MIEDILQFLFQYTPTIIYLTIDICILIFAIFIYKKNSLKYGIFLALYSIISIVSNVIYISIDYINLAYKLNVVMGLDVITVTFILLTWGIIFMVLGISSSIFLLIAVILIYRTYKLPRNL